jgi:uncharacterized membrane protein YhaH (DUF805 family)
MKWRRFLFSFEGRAPRREYWTFVGLIVIPVFVVAELLDSSHGYKPFEGPAYDILVLVLLWPSLAVCARRWHDRDKSARWILINFIPIVGGIWALIENGCLQGTSGDNRFGPDPLAAQT